MNKIIYTVNPIINQDYQYTTQTEHHLPTKVVKVRLIPFTFSLTAGVKLHLCAKTSKENEILVTENLIHRTNLYLSNFVTSSGYKEPSWDIGPTKDVTLKFKTIIHARMHKEIHCNHLNTSNYHTVCSFPSFFHVRSTSPFGLPNA